jgi:hypothetical protein
MVTLLLVILCLTFLLGDALLVLHLIAKSKTLWGEAGREKVAARREAAEQAEALQQALINAPPT